MGVPGTQSGRLTRPGLLVLAAAGAAMLMGACGSQAATTSSATQPASTASPGSTGTASPASTGTADPGSSSSAALCSEPAAVTRLVVSRVSALPQNHVHFAFPAGITVPSPARARAVAEAVCGLPAMPRVVMSCPADLGVSYRLSFAAGSRGFPVVIASAGGCEGVAGAGPVRSADRSPGFWTVLAHAMGIGSGASLRGTSPVRPGTGMVGPHTSPVRPGTGMVRPGISPVG
ncbi:MAG: hypothetical protein ACLP5E_17150 [Streptosporangiaceae bacterium]